MALFVEDREPATPWAFIHLSDVKEAIAGEGWVINCIEFAAASAEDETLVKEMVSAARPLAGPGPELRGEEEAVISINAMFPLRNRAYTSWDLAERIASSSPKVLQWCEVVDIDKPLEDLVPRRLSIRFVNAPVYALWGSTSWSPPKPPIGDAPEQGPGMDGGVPAPPQQPKYDDENSSTAEESDSSSSSSSSSSDDSSSSSSSSSAPPVRSKRRAASAGGTDAGRPHGRYPEPRSRTLKLSSIFYTV